MKKDFEFVEVRGCRVRVYSWKSVGGDGLPMFLGQYLVHWPAGLYPPDGVYRVPVAELRDDDSRHIFNPMGWEEKGYRLPGGLPLTDPPTPLEILLNGIGRTEQQARRERAKATWRRRKAAAQSPSSDGQGL